MDSSPAPKRMKTERTPAAGGGSKRTTIEQYTIDERSQVIDLCDKSESEDQNNPAAGPASFLKPLGKMKPSTQSSTPSSNPQTNVPKASQNTRSSPTQASQKAFTRQAPPFLVPRGFYGSDLDGDVTDEMRLKRLKRAQMLLISIIRGYEARKQELGHGMHGSSAEKVKICDRMIEKYTRFRDLLTDPANEAVVNFVGVFEEQTTVINKLHAKIQAQDSKIEETRAEFGTKVAMVDELSSKIQCLDKTGIESRVTALQSQVDELQHGREGEGVNPPQDKTDEHFAALSARVANLEVMMEAQDRARALFHDELVKIENSKERVSHEKPVNEESSQRAV